MKILHVIYIPRYSGAEILVRDLCHVHQSLDHTCGIVAIKPAESEFEGEIAGLESIGVRIWIPKNELGKFARIGWLKKAIRELEPDVIYGHSMIPSAYVRVANFFSMRCPCISVLHDAGENEYGLFRSALIEKSLGCMTSAVIAVSETAKRNYEKSVGTRNPVIHIPNGINMKAFSFSEETRDRVRREFCVPEDALIILQVGRICDVKQQMLSIEAIGKIIRQKTEVKVQLWLVGNLEDANYNKQLQQLVKDSRVRDNVCFLGPRKDVPALMCAADLYLMPSKHEAHSISFLEALFSNIPMVTSNIPSFSFAEGQPELDMVEDGDFVHSVVEKVNLLSNSRQRINRDVQFISIEKTAAAYLDLLAR